jgi:YhcG PDDEXK nuclease domain
LFLHFDKVKTDIDNPSIGLILCKRKSKFKAEYALRHINKLMAVAGYAVEIMKSLPREIASSLPTVKEIEAELEKDVRVIEESKK